MSLTRMQRERNVVRLNIIWATISIGCLVLGGVCGAAFATSGVKSEPDTSQEDLFEPGQKVQTYVSPTSQIRVSLDEPVYESLGMFTVYAYCPCEKCCGQWAGGPTASGVMPEEGRTIAADWDVLPAGTEVFINDHKYIVEDTGSGIIGNKIDIFMDSHQDALNWGVRELEVFYAAE